MEFTQLRYFVAAATFKNFSRAANECGITQPAISQQIRKLEKELGHTLFVRDGTGVSLTECGRSIYPDVIKILHAVDTLTEKTVRTTERPDESP